MVSGDDFYCKMCGVMLEEGELCRSCKCKIEGWRKEDDARRDRAKRGRLQEPGSIPSSIFKSDTT